MQLWLQETLVKSRQISYFIAAAQLYINSTGLTLEFFVDP